MQNSELPASDNGCFAKILLQKSENIPWCM